MDRTIHLLSCLSCLSVFLFVVPWRLWKRSKIKEKTFSLSGSGFLGWLKISAINILSFSSSQSSLNVGMLINSLKFIKIAVHQHAFLSSSLHRLLLCFCVLMLEKRGPLTSYTAMDKVIVVADDFDAVVVACSLLPNLRMSLEMAFERDEATNAW